MSIGNIGNNSSIPSQIKNQIFNIEEEVLEQSFNVTQNLDAKHPSSLLNKLLQAEENGYLSVLSQKYGQSVTTISSYVADLSNFPGVIAALNSKIDTVNGEISQTTNDIGATNTSIGNVNTDITNTTNDLNTTEANITTVTNLINNAPTINAGLQSQIDQLNTDNAGLTTTFGDDQTKLAADQARLNMLENENPRPSIPQALIDEINSLTQAVNVTIPGEIAANNGQIATLTSEMIDVPTEENILAGFQVQQQQDENQLTSDGNMLASLQSTLGMQQDQLASENAQLAGLTDQLNSSQTVFNQAIAFFDGLTPDEQTFLEQAFGITPPV